MFSSVQNLGGFDLVQRQRRHSPPEPNARTVLRHSRRAGAIRRSTFCLSWRRSAKSMAFSNAPGMLRTSAATAMGSTAFSALPTASGGGFSRRISAPKVSAKKGFQRGGGRDGLHALEVKFEIGHRLLSLDG
ncbi:MAG: hypothetical protein R3F36_06265 [Candidatus Competibacteraceae bacterium]